MFSYYQVLGNYNTEEKMRGKGQVKFCNYFVE